VSLVVSLSIYYRKDAVIEGDNVRVGNVAKVD